MKRAAIEAEAALEGSEEPSGKRPKAYAIVVDDDPDFQAAMAELIGLEGFAVEAAGSIARARALLAEQIPDLLLVDLKLPDGNGLDLLTEIEGRPATEVVLITGHASVDSAVEALRHGASDYLTKPVEMQRLKSVLVNVMRRLELRDEIAGLRTELRNLGRFGSLIGSSPAMEAVYDHITRVAPTSAAVLVYGESGTGKELVAESIHQLSRRRSQPFLALNCGAVSPHLIESELFGHERGSFTGADRMHKGLFERASSGTLLLDEITEMPIELQVKLLRALETGRVTRIGAEVETTADVRIIATTNRDPQAAVSDAKLRQDLLYRLSVFPIRLPPLRMRQGDVEVLAQYFLSNLNRKEGTAKIFTRGALARLRGHGWPGNVRELKNIVHRAFILADQEIDASSLPESLATEQPTSEAVVAAGRVELTIGSSIAEAERRLILATLDACDGNKEKAAHVLGISLKTLYNRLNEYKGTAHASSA